MIATILGVLCAGPLIPLVIAGVAALVAWGCSSSDEADDGHGSKAKDTKLRSGSNTEVASTSDGKTKAENVSDESKISQLIPELNCCGVGEEEGGICEVTEYENVYGQTTYEFTNTDGKYPGVFHDSMRSVALLASDMDGGDLEDWFVVRPHSSSAAHESGGILSDSAVVTNLVSFGNICHVDTFWTSANVTDRRIDSAGVEGGKTHDFDGAEGMDDEAEQKMIYGAFEMLNAANWNAYKMGYFGFAFAQMQESFRDDAIIESGYQGTLIDRLQKTEMEGTGKALTDGILSLIYSFAPTKTEKENESQWVKENLNHMGAATGQENFAQVLIAGYALHRAEDALGELIAMDKNGSDDVALFERKSNEVINNLALVNQMVGSSDKMASKVSAEMKANETNSHKLKPASNPKVTKEMLTNEYQQPFMKVIQDRAYSIYKKLNELSAPEKVEEPKKKPKPKKPKPKTKPKPKPKPKPEPKPEPKPKPSKGGWGAPVQGSKS